MYNVSATFNQEQVNLEGPSTIDMYVVNASYSGWDPLYYCNYIQNTYGFSMNATGDLVNTETLYTALPATRDGIKSSIEGDISGINISIPNVNRVIESVLVNNDNLRGRAVYVFSMFTSNLPSGVTANHIGVTPDKNAALLEKVYVDSVMSNAEVVSLSCKPKFNIRNIVLPRRKYSRECTWALYGDYAASSCDPEQNIDTGTYPTCDGSIDNCTERGNLARFGGFPSIPKAGIMV